MATLDTATDTVMLSGTVTIQIQSKLFLYFCPLTFIGGAIVPDVPFKFPPHSFSPSTTTISQYRTT